jgi:large subunit ribosomal protein L25
MKSVALNAHPRSLTRRLGAQKLRFNGRIPAVVYGREIKPKNLEIDRKEIEHLIHHSVSETRLVDLSITGESEAKRLALLQAVQHHPLTGAVLHVDLREVSPKEKVTIMVPIETAGESVGVKTGGGVLEHVLFRVRVRALPNDLPEFIQVDVSNLEIDQTIHISEIPPVTGVEILADPHLSVVSVAAPREVTEETTDAVAGAVAGAPGDAVEMIKEKKDEAGKAAVAGKADAKADAKGGAKGGAKPGEKAADKGGKK